MTAPNDSTPRLPHAFPIILVDRVVDIGDRCGTFMKLVTAADPCTAPDGSLPAAFVLEALAQSGAALLSTLGSLAPEPGYLAAVDDFHMLEPVRVGDQLRIEVEFVRALGPASILKGRAYVGTRLCAEGRFTLALPR